MCYPDYREASQAMLYRIPGNFEYKNTMEFGIVRNDIKSTCQNEEYETESCKHFYGRVAEESERKAASNLTEELLRNPE